MSSENYISAGENVRFVEKLSHSLFTTSISTRVMILKAISSWSVGTEHAVATVALKLTTPSCSASYLNTSWIIVPMWSRTYAISSASNGLMHGWVASPDQCSKQAKSDPPRRL